MDADQRQQQQEAADSQAQFAAAAAVLRQRAEELRRTHLANARVEHAKQLGDA